MDQPGRNGPVPQPHPRPRPGDRQPRAHAGLHPRRFARHDVDPHSGSPRQGVDPHLGGALGRWATAPLCRRERLGGRLVARRQATGVPPGRTRRPAVRGRHRWHGQPADLRRVLRGALPLPRVVAGWTVHLFRPGASARQDGPLADRGRRRQARASHLPRLARFVSGFPRRDDGALPGHGERRFGPMAACTRPAQRRSPPHRPGAGAVHLAGRQCGRASTGGHANHAEDESVAGPHDGTRGDGGRRPTHPAAGFRRTHAAPGVRLSSLRLAGRWQRHAPVEQARQRRDRTLERQGKPSGRGPGHRSRHPTHRLLRDPERAGATAGHECRRQWASRPRTKPRSGRRARVVARWRRDHRRGRAGSGHAVVQGATGWSAHPSHCRRLFARRDLGTRWTFPGLQRCRSGTAVFRQGHVSGWASPRAA